MAKERMAKGRARRWLGRGLLVAALLSLAASAAARDRTGYLIHLLRTSDTFRVRAQAALSLGRVDPSEAVTKALSGALRDPHPAVRSAAASSLQRLGDPSALPALKLARNDEHATVRKSVRRAIGRLERIASSRPRRTPLPEGGGGPSRYYVAVAAPKAESVSVPRAVLSRAHEALVKEVRGMDGVVVAPKGESPARAKGALRQKELLGYHVQSSVVRLEETSSGTRAVVSVVLATYPGREMRAMLQGAATAGSRGPEAAAQAIEGALRGALRRLPQALDASAQRDGG